jgi:hypothetical protein
MMAFGLAFVYLYGPGKMPSSYFVCAGLHPNQDPETGKKVGLMLVINAVNILTNTNFLTVSIHRNHSMHFNTFIHNAKFQNYAA